MLLVLPRGITLIVALVFNDRNGLEQAFVSEPLLLLVMDRIHFNSLGRKGKPLIMLVSRGCGRFR